MFKIMSRARYNELKFRADNRESLKSDLQKALTEAAELRLENNSLKDRLKESKEIAILNSEWVHKFCEALGVSFGINGDGVFKKITELKENIQYWIHQFNEKVDECQKLSKQLTGMSEIADLVSVALGSDKRLSCDEMLLEIKSLLALKRGNGDLYRTLYQACELVGLPQDGDSSELLNAISFLKKNRDEFRGQASMNDSYYKQSIVDHNRTKRSLSICKSSKSLLKDTIKDQDKTIKGLRLEVAQLTDKLNRAIGDDSPPIAYGKSRSESSESEPKSDAPVKPKRPYKKRVAKMSAKPARKKATKRTTKSPKK